jgi:hypothetical protein
MSQVATDTPNCAADHMISKSDARCWRKSTLFFDVGPNVEDAATVKNGLMEV